jgi:hypothetical protein
MKTFHPLQRPGNFRVFTALLVSLVILITPVVPAATGSPRFSLPAAPPAPATTVVSATKTDSWDDTATPDGKAEPGQTITYDVNVANSGAADATGVNFSDTIDPNTTLVPGSLRVSPLAFADSYSATVNTALSIAAPGVLGNDTGTPAPAAQPIAAGPTTQGGTVTLNADGSFNYTPPSAVFQGADTFTYTATNGLSPNDTATVTINVDDAPAVTTTSPTNGATGVSPNSNITINFTEPVNATTASFSVQCPTGTPQTFTLSASPSASFTLDPTANLPAGATCAVTVFASQITDADSFDPPDQMAADYSFSFSVSPLAVDDLSQATGNVRINTATTGYSVLTNDQAPGATITAYDATSAHGGEVTMNTTTGTFTYDPPRGFTGNDSFNYTITNSAGSDTGTVVVAVTDMVWFINNAAGACSVGCDGRLTHPFTSLAAFEAINGNGTTALGAVIDPEAGDNVFIYTGGGNYTGPVTLENNQTVVGQGAAGAPFGVGSLTGVTPAPDSDPLPSTGGTAPVITTAVTTGSAVRLAQNNHLHGLAFSNTDAAAISGTSNVGALLFSEIAVNNTGNGAAGISLTGGGSVTSTGVNTIATATGTPLNVANTNIDAGGLTFRSISSSGAASGIVLNNTGALGGLSVTGNGGTCTSIASTCTGGSILNSTGAGISLTSTKGVSLAFVKIQNSGTDGVNGTTVNGLTLDNSVVADVNTAGSVSGTFSDNGIELTNASGTFSVTNSLIDQSPRNGIQLTNTSTNLAAVNITNTTIGNQPNTSTSNNAVLITASGTSVISSLSVSGSTFTNVFATGLQLSLNNTSSVTSGVIQSSHFTGNNIAMNFVQANTSSGSINVVNNTDINNQRSTAINVSTATGTTTGGGLTMVIKGNTIGTAGVNDSGSAFGNAINLNLNGKSHSVINVEGNTVNEVPNARTFQTISRLGQVGGGGNNVRFANNTVNAPSGTNQALCGPAGTPCPLTPLYVEANSGNTVCSIVSGNTTYNPLTFTSGGEFAYYLRKGTTAGPAGTTTSSSIENNGGDATALDAVANHNTPSSPVQVDAGVTLVASGTCGVFPTVAALDSVPGLTDNPTSTVASVAPYFEQFKADGAVQVASLNDAAKYAVRQPAARPFATGAAPAPAAYSPAEKAGDAARESDAPKASAAPRALAQPFSGETVNANVGTLRAGKTVHITFQVTVDDPFPGTQASNQGTVTGDNFATVQTDDPAAGGSADATVTPILTPPSVSVKDATVAEPASGSTPAAFAVTLSHSYTHAVTVNYSTADGTATQPGDYTTTSGTVTFSPGQTVQTVSVPVNADADNAEVNETFYVNLSGATGGATIADAQGVGTITPESTPGTVIVSEVRTSGPAGADDDFVELYNNTDSPITVAASDASGGWALVKSGATCGDTPVVIAVIPNGTVIPARGNYLLTGTAYSLGAYAAGDQALVFNIEDDHNVALFNTADLSNISTAARLDAVGFGSNSGGNCDLLREGSTLQPAAGSTAEYSFVRSVEKGATADTNNNASDFVVVSTTAGAVGSNASPTLGAPGPENSTGARGPVPCNVASSAKFGRDRLDSTVALGSAPNTVRDATVVPNGANGTIDFRRTFTNNTGGNVTQLRFRITNVKDTSTPGTADLRALTSSDIVVTTSGGPVTVRGTTLEQPPAQTNGGSVNSSLGVGTITLGTPLASGASVNLHLLFGVQAVGDYHVSAVVETATAGSIGQDEWELRGNTEDGGASASEGGCNTPPSANAGADQTIECGGGTTSVTLDGTASTDADGDPLTYEWREGATVLGTGATLNTSLSFGPHTITLKVTDPSGDFSEDTVSVNIVDTTNPSITAPANVSVNTGPGASSCGVVVNDATLGTATASDGCSASVTVTRTGVPSGNNFPVGTTIVTYTADDGHGHTANAYQSVTVTDNTPPVITTPANIVVNAPPNSCSANVNPGTATATDNCAGVTVAGVRSDSQPLNAPYPVGTTTITWTATDAHGNTASGTQTVKVNDATPPTITLTTTAISLGSPNHQYHTLSIAQLVASVSDSCDPSVDLNDVVISQATSDETENGNGDGNTSNDIVIAPDCKSLQLRAERQGGGDGRVYHITLKVKDSSGNVATAVRTVTVTQGSGPAVDSGVHYTVGGCNP